MSAEEPAGTPVEWEQGEWKLDRETWSVRRLKRTSARCETGQLLNKVSTVARRELLAPHVIEVLVRAVGFDFQDLLDLLGSKVCPGQHVLEYSGVVVWVGQHVTEIRVGDRVFGVSLGALESKITSPAETMRQIPSGLSFESAASLPVLISTIHYLLVERVRLVKGQRILIHDATDGVGLVAIQYAQRLGCDVIVTAGSKAKQEYLAAMKLLHVVSSLDAEAFHASMQMYGPVDVVINRLSGAFIEYSLAALRSGGHFCEVGKRGAWSESQVKALRPDVQYHIVALDDMVVNRPSKFKQLFDDAVSFGSPELPLMCFSLENAEETLKCVQAENCVGQIVLTRQRLCDGNGAYVISGGLGYIGQLVARVLIEHGAQKIVLLSSSRSTLPDDWELEVRPEVVRCDVGERAEVQLLFDRYKDVRGVVHAAGVLFEGPLQSLGAQDFERVYHPKVNGARNLDECSRGLPLDFFVLFSSISSVYGTSRLATYASANGFLDALARRRFEQGLVGLSMRWGPWSGGGGMAAAEGVMELCMRSGLLPLDASLGVETFLDLIRHGTSQAIVNVCPLLPDKLSEIPYFSGLSVTRNRRDMTGATIARTVEKASWASHVLSLPRNEERTLVISTKILSFLSSLGLTDIDGTTPWGEAGLDSLSMIELRNMLSKALGETMQLSRTVLFDNPNVDSLVNHIKDLFLFSSGQPEELENEASLKILKMVFENDFAARASFQQEQMYTIQALDPSSTAYNEYVAKRFLSGLQQDVLKKSLEYILARHHVFQTSLQMVGSGRLMQIVMPKEKPTILEASVPDIPAAGVFLKDLVCTPFDLGSSPLYRAAVCRVSETEETWFVFVVHHAILDAHSIRNFLEELSQCYSVAIGGGKPEEALSPVVMQYTEYAAFQRCSILSEVKLNLLESYWRMALTNCPKLEFPTDFPRLDAAVSDVRGTVHFQVNPVLASLLKALSVQHGCTLFQLLVSVYGLLLCCLGNTNSVVVGFPCANRESLPDLQSCQGNFVNLLPLRILIESQDTVAMFLGRVKEAIFRALHHSDLPFQKMVQLWKSASPIHDGQLVQTMFNMLQVNLKELEGTISQNIEDFPIDSKMDFSMLVIEHPGTGLHCQVDFKIGLYSKDTAERIAGRYVALLASLSKADAASRLSDLSLISTKDMKEIQLFTKEVDIESDFLGFNPSLKGSRTLVDLFKMTVRSVPNGVAVLTVHDKITYKELDWLSCQLAWKLRDSHGVKPGDMVGLCVERCAGMVVGMLGILKAGAGYVPLDPEYPQARLIELVEDSGMSVVVAQDTWAGLFSEVISCGQVRVQSIAQNGRCQTGAFTTEDQPFDLGSVSIPADQWPCYMLYTSGSTGKPKGVLVHHAGVLCMLSELVGTLGIGSMDCTLLVAPFTFDMSVSSIFGSIVSCGSIVIVPRQVFLLNMADVCKKYGCTWISLTPSYLSSLSKEELLRTGIKTIMVGGEALAYSIINKWSGSFRMFNCYGPTETSVWITCLLCSPSMPYPRSIGRPFRGLRCYIVNKATGSLLPVGMVGELCISGTFVAIGYCKRPSETSKSFVVNPYLLDCDNDALRKEYARMYCTGDHCRWLPDGSIEFFGRVDRQVKFMGHRIELGEVESCLMEAPGVVGAVVVLDSRTLVGFVTPQQANVKCVHDYLTSRLPRYMIPSKIVTMETFPLTSSGKTDVKTLESLIKNDPAELFSSVAQDEAFQFSQMERSPNLKIGGHDSFKNIQCVPWQDREHAISKKIRQLLTSMSVEISDSKELWIEAGLDSLSMVELSHKLNTMLEGVAQLKSTVLFDNPTLDHLVIHIKDLIFPTRQDQPAVINESAANICPWYSELQGVAWQDLDNAIGAKIRQLLGSTGIDIRDSKATWVEAGLDSLNMVELSHKLNAMLGSAQLKGSILFSYPTLEILVQQIKRNLFTKQQEMVISDVPVVDPATLLSLGIPYGILLPCSFQQEIMCQLHFNHLNVPTCNMSANMMIKGSIRMDLFQKSFQTILDHHDCYRTAFVQINHKHMSLISKASQVMQIVAPPDSFPLPFEHLVVATASQAVQALNDLVNLPFDLSEAPLIRMRVCEVSGSDQCYVSLVLHHSISDLESVAMIMQEMSSEYNALLTGLPDTSAALVGNRLQYVDYTIWQRKVQQIPSNASKICNHVRKVGSSIPTDFPRQHGTCGPSDLVMFNLSQELVIALRRTCANYGCSLFQGLLAVYGLLMCKISTEPSEGVVIGFPSANRPPLLGMDTIQGLFAAYLSLHICQEGSLDFWFKSVHNSLKAAIESQSLPPESGVDIFSDCQAHFSYHESSISYSQTSLKLDNTEVLSIGPDTIDNRHSIVDLAVTVGISSSGGYGYLRFRSDLFTSITARQIVARYTAALENFISLSEDTIVQDIMV